MSYYRATEKYLYNYRALEASIENMKREIDEIEYIGVRATNYEQSDNGDPSSSTVENEVVWRENKIGALKKKIAILESKIERIDRAIDALNGIEKQIIEGKYFRGEQWWQIAHEVKYSERHCRRLKTNAVNKISVGLFGLPAMGEVDEATSQC